MYRTALNKLHHENWPAPIFYFPVFLYYIYSSLKHGGRFNYFSVVNPGLRTGGMCGFSKWDSYKLIDDSYVPKTLLLEKSKKLKPFELKQMMDGDGLKFPVILKPDRGERGFLVHKIDSLTDLIEILVQYGDQIDFLLQDYIEGELELGVFIIRNSQDWSISSLVSKKFLSVVGDGKSTILELCQKDPRAEKFFLSRLEEGDVDCNKDEVLPLGQKKVLEHIGNHCRGTEFVSEMEKNKGSLKKAFTPVVETQTDLNYFRLDLRAESWEELEKGNFKVLEVNGVSAEPGHIYDPSLSLTEAYKDLFHHWMQMSQIAGEQLNRGLEPESITETVKEVLGHLQNKKNLLNLQKNEEEYIFAPPENYDDLSSDEVLDLSKRSLPEDWKTLFDRALDLDGYLRFCLYKDAKTELVLCQWQPEKGSDLHFHPGKDCWFEALGGEVTEFREKTNGTSNLKAGDRGYICDNHGPHRMFNTMKTASFSLHYYKKSRD